MISEIENKRLLVADFKNPEPASVFSFDHERTAPLQGMIAPGDSGGGLFITTPTGTYLAGVNSFVGSDYGAPRSVYGNFSGHTRVSAFRDWIEARIRGDEPGSETVEPAAEPKEPEFKLYPAPEPGSLVLLFAAGVMLWMSRRLLRRS